MHADQSTEKNYRTLKQQNIIKESTVIPSPSIVTAIGAIIKEQWPGEFWQRVEEWGPQTTIDKGRQERDKREFLEAEIKQLDFPGWSVVKNPLAMQETQTQCGFDTWIRKIPWKKEQKSTPVFLPEESHGQWAWRATIHWVAKSQTQLKQLSTLMPDVDAIFPLFDVFYQKMSTEWVMFSLKYLMQKAHLLPRLSHTKNDTRMVFQGLNLD